MNRNILTTALLAASLALTAPALAALQANKPAAAETTPQRQPENNSRLQLAEHIKAQDLYGLWGSASETNEGSLLNMTFISPNGTGRDLMVFIVNQPQSILKIRQAFTWQFNEKTQTFILRVIDFSTTQDNEAYKQDKAQIGRTRTAKVRSPRSPSHASIGPAIAPFVMRWCSIAWYSASFEVTLTPSSTSE